MKLIDILFAVFVSIISFAHGSENWSLEPLGNYEIKLDISDFGGLSALKVHQLGNTFITISDRGKYFEGTMLRDSDGVIIDVKIFKSGSILNSSGNNLSGRNTDSESITTAKNKGFYISFESNHRIMFHKNLSSAGTFLPTNEEFKKLKSNKGIEAIATNAKGEIFAIPEEPPGSDTDFPVYKLSGDEWSIFSRFPASESFLVTDAVFLPDENILILERDYDWKVGFKMQLRILKINDNKITDQKKLLRINTGSHNHEGLSLWQNDSEDLFITSISDNNFLPFINSEVREFKLRKSQIK